MSTAATYFIRQGNVLASPRQGAEATEYRLSGVSRLIFGYRCAVLCARGRGRCNSARRSIVLPALSVSRPKAAWTHEALNTVMRMHYSQQAAASPSSAQPASTELKAQIRQTIIDATNQ